MKKNKNKRRESDFYPTPIEAIESLFTNYAININQNNILEPCAGNGIISEYIKSVFPYKKVHQIEIRKEEKHNLLPFGEVEITDFLKWNGNFNPDLIVTNPPFSLAQEFIEKSLTYNCTVIMLLRLCFLASKKRKEFWQKNPLSDLLVLSKRPSFTGNGKTDGQDYGWFVWNGHNKGIKVV